MLEIYISYFVREPIASIPVFLTVIPLVLLWLRRQWLDKAFYIFLTYLIIKFLIDIVMFDWAAHHRNNIIFYNVNVPVRYALCAWMFYQMMDSSRQRTCILVSMIAFTVFSVWDISYINPSISDLHNQQMVLFSSTLESLLMLFWILLYFYNTIRALKIPNLLDYPFFWVCSGLMIYYSSTLFINPVLHYATKWDQWLEIGYFYYVPYIFESLSILLFSVGIFQFPAKAHAQQ